MQRQSGIHIINVIIRSVEGVQRATARKLGRLLLFTIYYSRTR